MAKGTFDYDKVHETLQTLETYYEDFYRAIQAMDEAVAKVIDVGDDSAILGTRAATLIENWTTSCNIYKTAYYNMFRTWSGAVISASELYNEYEGTYQKDGAQGKKLGDIESSLTDEEKRDFDTMHNDAKNAAALINGGGKVEGNQVTVNGTPYEMHTGSNGEKYIVIDGKQYYIGSDKNGKVTSIKDSDGKTVKPPSSVEQQLRDKKNSMTPSEWENYKKGLTGDEKSAADYIDAGVMSTTDAQSKLKEETAHPDEAAKIKLPDTSSVAEDGDYKSAGKELLKSSQETEQYAYKVTEDNADYIQYYERVVKNSDTYKSMSPEEQKRYDDMVTKYVSDWQDIYNSTVSANKGGAFRSDNAIYDAGSAYAHGETRETLYNAAADAAADINGKIDNAMSPEQFNAEMAIFD